VQDAAADLILFERFKQRLEVAFTKTVIALSLDKLDEDRPDCCPAKALQQDLRETSFRYPFAVDQNAVPLETRNVLVMLWQTLVNPRIGDLFGAGMNSMRRPINASIVV
jgi:hypothetical protein